MLGNSRQPNRQDQRTATHCLRHRTLTHSCNQSAWCVPQKSITGAVGATLGNAPYKIGDRTEFIFPEMDIYPPDRLYIVILLRHQHP
ncbi:hypothetical protein [Microcystis aeruginosa]|uniref:hypothetical protein n=1 Tax=Microcystis aeruginosa TaxID=1126 RepID=UPI0011EA68BF|nr:hypothetical protein [Microcystis aeruginosa]